jgi:hypothetical protein
LSSACSYLGDRDGIEKIEPAVYAALLAEALEGVPQSERPRLILVKSKTTLAVDAIPYDPSRDSGIGLEKKLRSLAPRDTTDAAITSFMKNGANRAEVVLPKQISGSTVQIVETAQIERIFSDSIDSWPRFRAAFPGARGFTSLSRVGWDPVSSQALVIVGTGCGPLCGSGYVVLLRRESGTWKTVDQKVLWVS